MIILLYIHLPLLRLSHWVHESVHSLSEMATSGFNGSQAQGYIGVPYCGSEFHFGFTETILFGSWRINSLGGLLWSSVVIAVVTFLYEGLKYYRESLFQKPHGFLQYKSDKPTMWNRMHVYQTVLHGIQFLLSYFVMLIFMIYNVWLCLAILIGVVVGYFAFAWKKSTLGDLTECCH